MESEPSDVVILIKHARPRRRRDRPAAAWELSPQGRRASRRLAHRLAPYEPRSIVSSEEPKAAETARQVAEQLGIQSRSAPNLHEHARASVRFYESHQDFAAEVQRLFDQPHDVVFGEESATQACARFEVAVQRVIEGWAAPGPVAIVSHGTVISLLLGRWCGSDPRDTWSRLGLPSFVVLSREERRVIELVEALPEAQGHP